jgi:Xaa-Pro aminopeptidase
MYKTDVSKEEFRARRAGVFEAIGPDAVALVRGSAKNRDHNTFRQNNDFYYLCGVEVPHAFFLARMPLAGRKRARSCQPITLTVVVR